MKTKGHPVCSYTALFRKLADPVLFSEDCIRALDTMDRVQGNVLTHQVIYEVHLNDDSRSMDFSFRVDTKGADEEKPLVANRWREYDYESYAFSDDPLPCIFFDAVSLRTKEGALTFVENALPELTGQKKAELLSAALLHLCDLLPKRRGLFQVGSMDNRKPSRSVRIYTNDLTPDQIDRLLADMNWTGERQILLGLTNEWKEFAYGGTFVLSFDLFSDHISEKIGVEFHPHGNSVADIRKMTAELVAFGFCLPDKADAVCRWFGEPPQAEPYIQNDISHIKFSFEKGQVRAVKAYLRQSDEFVFYRNRRFRSPLQMNLELTTECPLRCPQCYVHLNTGQQLPYERAMFWLSEAARAGVRYINLSGGETLCYPRIDDLVAECKRLGLESNLALSGAFVTAERLQRLIDAGADNIFVSLNGSTKKVNEQTRDGYELAIRTLELLRELRFPNVTINYVMHRSNAENLPDMIRLAEEYQVKSLVVMAFKPDAAHELKSFPTPEQLKEAAGVIKRYKGPVRVEVETCFSQLRVLIGRSALLGNRNLGIFRGCGAGRDGISVNVEGKLTPCRHLDAAEEYDSIMEYWEKSPFLKKLCEVEDHRKEPCLGCQYEQNCLPCMAVGYKLHGEITYGLSECMLERNRFITVRSASR